METLDNTTTKEIKVTEYATFDEAYQAATNTKESFEAFQTGTKLQIMKEGAVRFFVDQEKNLWYTHMAKDGLRILHEARVYSMLSNSDHQYVQIMKGKLRFTNQYCDRKNAIEISKMGEVYSFKK